MGVGGAALSGCCTRCHAHLTPYLPRVCVCVFLSWCVCFGLQELKEFFHNKFCIGFVGGKANHALYFAGYRGNALLGLDPHTVFPTPPRPPAPPNGPPSSSSSPTRGGRASTTATSSSGGSRGEGGDHGSEGARAVSGEGVRDRGSHHRAVFPTIEHMEQVRVCTCIWRR